MNSKKIAILLLDVAVVVTALIGINLTYSHIDNRQTQLIIIAALALLALFVIVWELYTLIRQSRLQRTSQTPSVIALIGDREQVVRVWDLNKQIGVLVGKSSDLVDADINLADTEYAPLLDNEHATINYTMSGWWLEDLASMNGTILQRKGKEIPLSAGSPYKLSSKDIILLANHTRLVVR